MPMNPAFVQLLLGLQDIKLKRRQLDQDDEKFKASQNQFKAMVEQFNHTHDDQDAAKALEQIGKLTPDMMHGFEQLMKSTTFKNNPDALQAIMSVATNSPAVKGRMSMLPQQNTALNQEAAALQATGGAMGTGGVGQSQLTGAFAGMNPQPPGTIAGGVTGDAFKSLVQNFAARNAQGYTADQMEVDRFQASTGRYGAETQMAALREQHNQFMAAAGIPKGKEATQLTGGDIVSLQKGMSELLTEMRKPTADEGSNKSRMQNYNSMNYLLRLNGLPGTSFFPVEGWNTQGPAGSPGMGASQGNPPGIMSRFIQGQMPGMFAPSVPSPMPAPWYIPPKRP